jgi:hypothetical protein
VLSILVNDILIELGVRVNILIYSIFKLRFQNVGTLTGFHLKLLSFLLKLFFLDVLVLIVMEMLLHMRLVVLKGH